MPAGEYLLTPRGPHGSAAPVVERFRCATGPAGWRYTSVVGPEGEPYGPGAAPSERVDLTLDALGRQVRVEVGAGGWTVRGGSTGRHLLWLRRPAGPGPGGGQAEQREDAAGFAGRSGGFLVAADRLLRLSTRLEVGASAALRLVLLSPPVLATSVVAQRWTLTGVTDHVTDLGVLPVRSYTVLDLATGQTTGAHVGGDVVLDAPGVQLHTLDGPPSLR